MRGKRAKALRRYVQARTTGRPASETKAFYCRVKRAFDMMTSIRPPNDLVTTHYFGARQDRADRRSTNRTAQERAKAQDAA